VALREAAADGELWSSWYTSVPWLKRRAQPGDRIMDADSQLLHRVRKQCLSFPEVSEVSSWGHPNFRAGKRTFVTFESIEGRPSIAFRLDPVDVDLVLRRREFFATPYGQGRWVSVWADASVGWSLVERLLTRSYRIVALKRMIGALDSETRTP
jgi:predicted DNA-binding protein (MmcQ/YjbR family)